MWIPPKHIGWTEKLSIVRLSLLFFHSFLNHKIKDAYVLQKQDALSMFSKLNKLLL